MSYFIVISDQLNSSSSFSSCSSKARTDASMTKHESSSPATHCHSAQPSLMKPSHALHGSPGYSDHAAAAASSTPKTSPREITKSSPPPTPKTVHVTINVDLENEIVQTFHMDNSASESKLYHGKGLSHWVLLSIASLMLLVGLCAGTLLGRLYFVHGGSRRWLYTWLQSAGWPINLIPLCICYAYKKRYSGDGDITFRHNRTSRKLVLFSIYVAMGFLAVVNNLIFSWGLSFLPASTSALLLSSQLAFNAIFSYVLVGHKMTPSVLNSVFAMTIAAVLLGLHADTDRPPGTTQTQYIVGFILIIAAAALNALVITLLEVIYKRVLRTASSLVAMEVQTNILALATVMATVGMWAAGDFHAMRKESERFDLGRGAYVVTLIASVAAWEVFLLGAAGVVLLGSSLFTCVQIMAGLPMVSLLSFVFFRDVFSPLKAISMLISVWGIVSYIYGGYSDSNLAQQRSRVMLPNL